MIFLVACAIDFNLLCDDCRKGRVLKLKKIVSFKYLSMVVVFSPQFWVGQEYNLEVGGTFLLVFHLNDKSQKPVVLKLTKSF